MTQVERGRENGGRIVASVVSALLALMVTVAGHATTLSDAAAALQPGQWAEINTTGFNQALLGDSNGHNIFQYTEDIVWDPVSKQLLFVGGGHGSDAKFISYSDSSNAWQLRPQPSGFGGSSFSHAYDHNGIDPVSRRFFHRQPGGNNRIDVWNIDTNTWTRSPAIPSGPQCCGAVEWFPEISRAVYVDGSYGIFSYNPANDGWSTASNNLEPLGDYHLFAEYSPVHKVLFFGGGNGSSAIYKMNASSQITRISPDAPDEMGTTHSIVTLDPNSGNFLVYYSSSNWYEYNPATNVFSRMSGSAPFGGIDLVVATPISTYGVTLFAKYNGDQSKVWIYKHSPGSGVVQPTVSLSADPTSVPAQGTTTLTWSSTNADSCDATGGWSGAHPTSGTESRGPLSANTTFTLTCINDEGGRTARSVTVSVVSSTPTPSLTFTADPTSVALNGTSTLSWTSSNATSCTASGDWSGAKQPTGSASVGPLTATGTYNLSCTGAGGTIQRSATISLVGAPSVDLTAAPTAVASGARSQLSWTSQNATSCVASGGWTGTKATSGTQQTAALTTATDYSISCTGVGGTAQDTVRVTVNTTAPPPGPAPAPTVVLSVTSNSVVQGSNVTLQWNSTNTTSCSASGGWSGVRGSSGSETIGPLNVNTTFTLQCTGAGGMASDQEAVDVTAAPPANPLPPTAAQTDSSGGGAFGGLWIVLLGSILGLSRASRLVRRVAAAPALGAFALLGALLLPQAASAVDFATRCADANVVRCYGFEDANDLGNRTLGRSGDNRKMMALDTAQKTSGNSSLKFTIEGNTGADTSGSFFLHFADDFSQRFGAGSEFYVQWRQRFSPDMVRAFAGGNGWKQIIIGAGDTPGNIEYSCSEQETVIQQDKRLPNGGFPNMYHSCGRFDTLEFHDGTQVRMQHQGPPYCYYPDDPDGGCFKYRADQWLTFQVHIKIVSWNQKNSTFQAWAAYEGQSSVKIFDTDIAGAITYYRNNDPDAFFGKVWLTPYNTNKSSSEAHPTAYTWYDDLIISRARIPDPDATAPAPTPVITLTANPTSVNAQGSSTLTWSATNSDTCTATPSPLWSGTKPTSGSATVGPITANTTFSLRCSNDEGGEATKTVAVSIVQATPAPTVTFSASPASVAVNGTSTLNWTTSNATACTASGAWSGNKSVPNGSQSVGPLAAAATYNLSCTGTGGTTQRSVTISLVSGPSVDLNVNPTTVASGGTSQLSWTSQNATSCSASGAWSGNKATSGNQQSGALSATSDFTLTCIGPGGSAQDMARVTISTSTPPPPAAPTVSLSASASSIPQGSGVTLQWSSTDATACTASGGWSGAKATSGSEAIATLTAAATFTLQCTGQGGSASDAETVSITAQASQSSDSGGGAFDWLALSALALLLAGRRRVQRSGQVQC